MRRDPTIWHEEGPNEVGRSPDATENSPREKLGGVLMLCDGAKM